VNGASYQGQQIKYDKMGRAYTKNRSHEATFNINRKISRRILKKIIVYVRIIIH